MSDERDEQGRPESPRYGQDPSPGSGGWGSSADGQTAAQGQPGWDQPSYGQPSYGQPSYGQSPYGQSPYEQAAYGQSSYGQEASPYGHQAGYGQGGVQGYGYGQSGVQGYGWGAPPPARPGGVITAAVLGFVFGALGVLVTVGLLIGGAALTGASSGASSLDDELGLGDAFGTGFAAAAGAVFVVGVLALVWTVLVIWGSAWALTGRSRVLLLVAGSISIAVTGFLFIATLSSAGQEGFAGGLVFSLLFFAGAIAIVVLLSISQASRFFAAHRARRTAVG